MEVKGMGMNARLAFVRARFGPDGERKLFDKLPELRSHLFGDEFLVSKMFPYEDYVRLNQAVDDLFFNGKEKAYIDMGEDSAAHALNTVHKVFVSSRDVKNFLRSLPVIYNAYYRGLGEAVSEVAGMENKAFAAVAGIAKPHRSMCQIIYGYLRKGMELCGAKNIRITERACMCRSDKECRFDIEWE